MLMPKRVKRIRVHRGRMTGVATRGNYIAYGEFGLQAVEPAWVTSNQIEAARVAMTRFIKRGGQVWIKIFPDKPVTKSQPRPVWEAVRVRLNTGLQLSSPAEYYLRSREYRRKLPEKQ